MDLQELQTLFPVRCYTCGKVIGQYQIFYEEQIKAGRTPKEIMDQLGVTRYCCRMNMLNPAILPMGGFTELDKSLLEDPPHEKQSASFTIAKDPLVNSGQTLKMSPIKLTSVPATVIQQTPTPKLQIAQPGLNLNIQPISLAQMTQLSPSDIEGIDENLSIEGVTPVVVPPEEAVVSTALVLQNGQPSLNGTPNTNTINLEQGREIKRVFIAR